MWPDCEHLGKIDETQSTRALVVVAASESDVHPWALAKSPAHLGGADAR